MSDKIIIVSGGTGNLGKAVVDVLSEQPGYKIYLPVRNLEKFNKMYDNSSEENAQWRLRKIYGFQCDLNNNDEIKNFVESVAKLENNKIDILINLAGGIHPPKDISEIDEKFFMDNFKLNFLSAFNLSEYSIKYMKENSFGRIVFIGALAGLNMMPGRFVYSMSKASLISLMNSISLEMKEYNIKCNLILPSMLDTKENRLWGGEDEAKNWVTPEEVAGIIADIISDKYKSLNKSIIKVLGNY